MYHAAEVQMPGVQRRRGEESEGEPLEKRKNQIVKGDAGGRGFNHKNLASREQQNHFISPSHTIERNMRKASLTDFAIGHWSLKWFLSPFLEQALR